MNQLIFDRSTGNLSPPAFAQAHTSQRIYSIQPAHKARFNGGEKEVVPVDDTAPGASSRPIVWTDSRTWAHQSGVNALGIDIENQV